MSKYGALISCFGFLKNNFENLEIILIFSSFLRKFHIKVKNPPPLYKKSLPLSPTTPFLEKIFHSHPYCQVREVNRLFIRGWGRPTMRRQHATNDVIIFY